MKHSLSNRKELTILKLEEVVFDVRHADWFRKTIERMVSVEQSRNLIVDFSQVKAIDSCGISSMLLAHQLANQSDGLAIFVSLCQQIKELLKLANLDRQLYIFSSINEVMTLIEPALKSKRSSKSKARVARFDHVDDLAEGIDILPDEVFHNDSFPGMLDDGIEVREDVPEEDATAEKPGVRKRGRPRKNAASADTGEDDRR
jgi:anti-anti-sigma factor